MILICFSFSTLVVIRNFATVGINLVQKLTSGYAVRNITPKDCRCNYDTFCFQMGVKRVSRVKEWIIELVRITHQSLFCLTGIDAIIGIPFLYVITCQLVYVVGLHQRAK